MNARMALTEGLLVKSSGATTALTSASMMCKGHTHFDYDEEGLQRWQEYS